MIVIFLIPLTSGAQTEFKYSFLAKDGSDYFKEHTSATYNLARGSDHIYIYIQYMSIRIIYIYIGTETQYLPTEWGLFTRGNVGVKTPEIAVPTGGLHKLTLFLTAYSSRAGYFPLFEINTNHGHHAALVNFGGLSSFPYHKREECKDSTLFKYIPFTSGRNTFSIYIYIYIDWAHIVFQFSDEIINHQQLITIKHFYGDKQETVLKTLPLCTLNLFDATDVSFSFRPSTATYNYLLREIKLSFNDDQYEQADNYITSIYIYIYI